MNISFVIVSYKSFHLIEKHIINIPKENEIIIIENSLDKNVKSKFEKLYSNVQVIIPQTNLGYGKALNLGLQKAKNNGGENESSVLTNLGIVASWNGDLNKAQKLFDQANTSNYNKATLNLRMGDYRSSTRYYRGNNTYNATLANILNGNNNSTCSENTAACYYLNAIAGARSGNEEVLFSNLEKAISADESYKAEALTDLEFSNYTEHEKFISLTK